MTNGIKGEHKPQKAPNRRWFSTFRPKPAPYKEKDTPHSSQGGSESQNEDEFPEKSRMLPPCPQPSLTPHTAADANSASPGRHVNMNHRRSLSSVFKTVKTRYSRDKLNKNGFECHDMDVMEGLDPISQTTHETITTSFEPRRVSPPPRLDVLCDLAPPETTSEPSTFRAGLEKAVSDINNKYGTPSNSCLAPEDTDTGASRLMSANSLPFPKRTNFRPRYQVPTFVDVPVKTAQSSAGDLQQLSPITSTDSVSIGTSGVNNAGSNGGGCHLPTLSLEGVLGPSFDIAEFMTTQPVIEQSTPGEAGSVPAELSAECPSSKNSTHTVVREPDTNRTIEPTSDSSIEEQAPDTAKPVPSPLIMITANAEPVKTNSEEELRCHRRRRSNSEQPSRSPSGSRFGSFDHESLISEIGSSEVRRLRSKSTPDNSEGYSEIMLNSRQPSGSSQASMSHEENVPSVSELVSKFRRMGSLPLPGTFPASSPSETPNPHPALRKVSRGKQFETYRSRFSNESEGDSGLVSNPEDVSDNCPLIIPKPGRERSFLTSEDVVA